MAMQLHETENPISGSEIKLSDKLSILEAEVSSNLPAVTAQGNVWRQIDLWVLPMVTMLFFLQFLVRNAADHGYHRVLTDRRLIQDKGNVGNARVAGLQKELGMSDTQVSNSSHIVITDTFIGCFLHSIVWH